MAGGCKGSAKNEKNNSNDGAGQLPCNPVGDMVQCDQAMAKEGAMIKINDTKLLKPSIPPIRYAESKVTKPAATVKREKLISAVNSVNLPIAVNGSTLEDRLNAIHLSTDSITTMKDEKVFEPAVRALEGRIRQALEVLENKTGSAEVMLTNLEDLQMECENYLELCRVTLGAVPLSFRRKILQLLSSKVVALSVCRLEAASRKKIIHLLCKLISLFN